MTMADIREWAKFIAIVAIVFTMALLIVYIVDYKANQDKLLQDCLSLKTPIGAIVQVEGQDTCIVFGSGKFEIDSGSRAKIEYLYNDGTMLDAGVVFSIANGERTTTYYPPGNVLNIKY